MDASKKGNFLSGASVSGDAALRDDFRKPSWIEYQLKKSIHAASGCGFRVAGIVKVIRMK